MAHKEIATGSRDRIVKRGLRQERPSKPLACDPKVLLQGPETSKVPKVVRRGCKSCFGHKEQRSPKSLLHYQNPVLLERGEKTPTPNISALLRKRPVLLRANFVLTKDRKRPYYGHFCGKTHKEGSCSKAAGGP